jgi:hypothetical protein
MIFVPIQENELRMNPRDIIAELRRNKAVFESMLRGVPEGARIWKPPAGG